MRYGYIPPPNMGYYGEPPENYGYYGEDPYGAYAGAPYGYYGAGPYGEYAESPYGEPDVNGYYGYGQPNMYGNPGYGEYEPVGYLAEEQPVGSYGEDPYGEQDHMGLYGEPNPSNPYGYYGQVPEMVGYGEYEPMGEEYPSMGYYGEPDMAGYVRDMPPSFNAGCPLPTNVAGFGEAERFAGYMKPAHVSPTCQQFTAPPSTSGPLPDTFRPLW